MEENYKYKNAAIRLSRLFIWTESDQGWIYWNDVYDRLYGQTHNNDDQYWDEVLENLKPYLKFVK